VNSSKLSSWEWASSDMAFELELKLLPTIMPGTTKAALEVRGTIWRMPLERKKVEGARAAIRRRVVDDIWKVVVVVR
jgi:hypothetical protein